MNFGVFTPVDGTGEIGLHTTYTPELREWPAILSPGKEGMEKLDDYFKAKKAGLLG